MNPITLYKIYETTRDNSAPDLTIGLAMLRAEHPEVRITHGEDKALRAFMGRHGRKLARAFPDPEAFLAVVSTGAAEDAEQAEEEQ